MQISINGYRSNNQKLTEGLMTAVWWYGLKLLGGRQTRHLWIDINLTKNLFKKSGAYGFCGITGNENKPREFEIELDASMDNSFKDLLIWCAHEMVHVKQFVREELVDYDNGNVGWKSKVFRDKKFPYTKQPWEKQAYKLELKLYEEFIEYYERGE